MEYAQNEKCSYGFVKGKAEKGALNEPVRIKRRVKNVRAEQRCNINNVFCMTNGLYRRSRKTTIALYSGCIRSTHQGVILFWLHIEQGLGKSCESDGLDTV
jgi:hypothetical protein